MTAAINVKIRDHSDEYTTVRFPVAEALAIDTWADIYAMGLAAVSAVQGLVLGTVVSWSFTQVGQEFTDERPASDWAQRENALRFHYHGVNSGKKGSLSIGTVDLGVIDMIPGTDLADMTDAEVAAVIAFIQGNVEIPIPNPPPATGYWNDDVVVDTVVYVGRPT